MRPAGPYQPGLDRFTGLLWLPDAAGTGGAGLGPLWAASAGTVSLATPAAGIATQLRRNKFMSSGANQALGPAMTAADARMFYRTNSGTNGGFYMSATFTIEAWVANNARLFIGLADSVAGTVVNADYASQTGEIIGLYHDVADGANVLSILTKGVSASAKTPLSTNVATLAAGQAFQFEMWSFPGDPDTYLMVTSLNTNTRVCYGQTFEGPNVNTMLQPAVQMNPASDATANDFGIGVANILAVNR